MKTDVFLSKTDVFLSMQSDLMQNPQSRETFKEFKNSIKYQT